MGVLTDAFLDQFDGDIDLRLQIGKFPLQFVRCESRSKCTLENRDEPLFGTDDRVGGLKEQGFDLLFVQRGGGAFSTVELVVALLDDLAVGVVAVPHLRTVPAAAVGAHDPARENADAAPAVIALRPGRHQRLHHLESLTVDDGLVIVPNVVLRDLALVGLFLLCEEIDRVGLLKERVALVLLIREDAADVAGVPMILRVSLLPSAWKLSGTATSQAETSRRSA